MTAVQQYVTLPSGHDPAGFARHDTHGREAMATDQISSARLRLVPLTVADAAEMVDVLSGEALYAYTGGAPPGVGELRARYAR